MQECTYFSKKKTSISIDTIIKNEFSSVTNSKSFRATSYIPHDSFEGYGSANNVQNLWKGI